MLVFFYKTPKHSTGIPLFSYIFVLISDACLKFYFTGSYYIIFYLILFVLWSEKTVTEIYSKDIEFRNYL